MPAAADGLETAVEGSGQRRPGAGWSPLTLPIDWQIQIVNLAVLAEYFVQVVLVDIFGEALHDNLHRVSVS